jgi:uncharacterized protein (DUF2164 family)
LARTSPETWTASNAIVILAPMSRIELDKKTQEALVKALGAYLKDELDIEIGGFEAQFLLDFIGETMGAHFYNQGLQDAQAIFRKKVDLILEAVYELEKPVKT